MQWLSDLHKKSMRRAAKWLILCLTLAIGLSLITGSFHLFGMLAPKRLAQLNPNAMEGAYVQDELPFFYGAFIDVEAYRGDTPTGNITGRYYVIDFDRSYYMGLYVHEEDLADAQLMLAACEAYLAGNLRVDLLPFLRVNGTICAMSRQEREFYYEIAQGDERLEAIMLPYYLEMGRVHGKDPWFLLGSFGCSVLFLAIGLFFFVKAALGSYQKTVRQTLSTVDCLEEAAQQAALLLDQGQPVSGVWMNDDFVFFRKRAHDILLRSRQVAWVYPHVTTHRFFGIPVHKTFSVVFRMMDGQRYAIKRRKAQIQALLEAMQTQLPGVVLGYSEETEQLYRTRRDWFEQRWEDGSQTEEQTTL